MGSEMCIRDRFKRIQKFLLFNLKMTVERSKRRCFLTLTFIVMKFVYYIQLYNNPSYSRIFLMGARLYDLLENRHIDDDSARFKFI